MDNIDLSIFVVPIIALTLIITFYVHFFRKAVDKHNYRYYVVTVAVIAFILNLVWEVAQGSLYEGYQYDWQHISFCALASVADMLMVLILLFGFGLVYKNVFWIRQLNMSRVLILILVGGTGAILAEMWHTARGDWSYSEAMPLLPLVEVGISPVLQFTILPLTIFLISKKVSKL